MGHDGFRRLTRVGDGRRLNNGGMPATSVPSVWVGWKCVCLLGPPRAVERSAVSNAATHVYCTIVAQNYLPQALALYESVRLQEPGVELELLVIDADRRDLMDSRPGLRVVTSGDLGLTALEFDYLAGIYDVVELSTSVKPLLLRRLLAEFEYAAYLDPDMYLVAPLSELGPALSGNPIQLTPHFLHPIPPGSSYISEVHSLTVGVHNLGFCAVARGAEEFLDWWWTHLSRECLIYPLLGIFVDQKWTDVGGNLFGAASLRHPGYNVGPWNLHERPIHRDGDELLVGDSGDALRLMHFSGFDPRDPDAISVRLSTDLRGKTGAGDAFSQLSHEYAKIQLAAKKSLGKVPNYGYAADSTGRQFSTRLRRAYRADLLESEKNGTTMPSPFSPEDAAEYARWRRRSWLRRRKIAVADAAIAAKYAFPDAFRTLKKRAPRLLQRQRSKLLSAGEVRR